GKLTVRAVVVLVLASTALACVRLANPDVVWHLQRAQWTEQLESAGGRHVIFVRPLPDFDFHSEWVFNGPEIDAQPVVWARDLGGSENRQLIDYYPGRKAWILEVGQSTARLIQYPLEQFAGQCTT
ncbi:MAG: hypothetical protein ACREVM_10990, partial [Burkholderiales bacterium]